MKPQPLLMRSETLAQGRESQNVPGVCNISAEILKARDVTMKCRLHALLAALWQSDSILPD